MIGQTILHYKIFEKLGEGGMGVVYKAEDTKLKRTVAIKFLPRQISSQGQERERFKIEAQAAAALNHPNIATIYAIEEVDDEMFIVMEFIEGKELRDIVKASSPVTTADAIHYATQIAEGLKAAHAKGITHRDIKSSNIMVTESGQVKILDFGLAKLTGQTIRLTKTGMAVGTVAYMSPEQAQCIDVDHRTDIWSLGVVLYEMLTGRLPFRGEYEAAFVYSILNEEPLPMTSWRSVLPAGIERMVKRTLAKNAHERYQTTADLLSALRHVKQELEREAQIKPRPISPDTPSPSIKRPEAERRQMTAMFCSMAGSTSLAEPLDPEELHQVLPVYQDLCAKVINRFGGYIAQYLGDGILVYFGYPQAHEDDARRAVHAGLGIVEGLKRMNIRLYQEKGITLALRVGIHTGLVVAGEKDDPSQSTVIVGETPSIATQLQNLADPDSLVISQATYRLIKGFFDCRESGTHSIKGIPQSTQVYQVLHESTARTRLEAVAMTGLTPLVGREKEIGLLQQRWEQAVEGMGQVVLLSGEAGIGKSRLVQELKAHVAANPKAWLSECNCSPYHQSSALYPIIDFLERVVLQFQREDSPQKKLNKLEGYLAQYGLSLPETVPLFAVLLSIPLDGKYPPLNLSPERQKQKTLATMLTILLERAAQQPVLFVVEDLHWADPSTLEFINLIIDQGPTAKVLTLLTFRPDFTPPWTMRSHLHHLTVSRLPKKEIENMAGRVAKGKALPQEVLGHVVSKTDGVPLFVEEMTKMVLESGMLKERGDQYELAGALPQLAIPTTLRDSLTARLDRLATAKEVAQLGAVLGREFPYEWLQAVSPLDETTLHQELARLVEAELLYQRGIHPQVTYIFKHALIQEAAYESLLKSKRQQYHRQIAEIFAKQFPNTVETHPELLAHHYASAGLIEQALPCLQRAGQQALQRYTNLEAVVHFTRALELLKTLPDTPERTEQEMNFLVALGEAKKNAGQFSQSMETFQRAADLAKRLRSPEDLARAALGFEEARWRYNLPAGLAARLLEEALNALGKEDSIFRCRVLASLARALIYSSPERSASFVQQALEMARRINDPSAVLDALRVSLFTQGGPEKIEERMAALNEMLRLAQEVDNRERIAEVRSFRLFALLELGDIQAVDAEIEAHDRMAKMLQQPIYIITNSMFRAMRALLDGRFEEAERLIRQTMDMAQGEEDEAMAAAAGIQMFTLRREQGRLRELAPIVKSFVAQHPAVSTWRPGLALIYSELGLEQEARAEFEYLAANDFTDIPKDALWMTCIAYLSEVCAFLGDTVRAATLYQLLLPYAGHTVVISYAFACSGAASRYLGRLAATMSRWEEAEKHFEDALAMNARMGAKPLLARTQHEYAEMLLARGRAEDRVKAMSLLDEALVISRELGMKSVVEKVLALKKDQSQND